MQLKRTEGVFAPSPRTKETSPEVETSFARRVTPETKFETGFHSNKAIKFNFKVVIGESVAKHGTKCPLFKRGRPLSKGGVCVLAEGG